jgi:general secretion pathway protein A
LRQLNQRITARYNLNPLNLDETSAYIQHRLQVAGMSPERVVFSPAVVRGIYKATRGIPRVINVLCDRMLLGAYGRNTAHVDHNMLRLAVQEVLGEQEPADTTMWRWIGVAVAVLLIVWAGGWLLGKYAGAPDFGAAITGSNATPPAVIEEQPVEQSTGQATEPEAMTPGVSAVVEQNAAPAIVEAPLVSTIAPAVPPAPETIGVAGAMLPPGDTFARLWALNSDQPVPAFPCADTVQQGLACAEGEVWTWDELAAFNRPLSLETITPERFSAEVLLLGIEGFRATVLTEAGIAQVSLADLAPYWTGRYRFLWRPPVDFGKPLVIGDSGPVVAAVAQLFAQLDNQPKPLAERYFNRALEQRVRLFQQQNALIDDGVVGVQTLLKLNEQLGLDVTAKEALKQLQRDDTQQAME